MYNFFKKAAISTNIFDLGLLLGFASPAIATSIYLTISHEKQLRAKEEEYQRQGFNTKRVSNTCRVPTGCGSHVRIQYTADVAVVEEPANIRPTP